MPLYIFQCRSCGVQFDAVSSLAKRGEGKTCPACGTVAVLVPPPTVQGHFKKEVTGPVPQNTGIHDLDTHIDRVIGQSAAQGREVIRDRHRTKQQILDDNPGLTGADLSRNPDGSYRVLRPEERAAHRRAQNIHTKHGEWKTKMQGKRRSVGS